MCLWVPERRVRSCDLLILVDEAAEAVALLDLAEVGSRSVGEWTCGSSVPQRAWLHADHRWLTSARDVLELCGLVIVDQAAEDRSTPDPAVDPHAGRCLRAGWTLLWVDRLAAIGRALDRL